jgi:hypothetical protein
MFDERRRSIRFGPQGWKSFLLELLIYRTTFVVGRMVAVTEYATYIARLFLTRAKGCRMRSGTFDASWLLVTKVFRVPISLTIGTLGDVSFKIGGFKLNFALLKEFNLENVFVIGGGF